MYTTFQTFSLFSHLSSVSVLQTNKLISFKKPTADYWMYLFLFLLLLKKSIVVIFSFMKVNQEYAVCHLI